MVVPRIATNRDRKSRDQWTRGSSVAARTAFQSGWARKAVATYANRTSVSHLKIRAIRRYDDQKSRTTISPAYTGVQNKALIPVTNSVACAMPPKSAPMLITLARSEERRVG